MQYQVVVEGQTIQLPPGIGEKDEDVKRAMSPYFPEISTALLTRKVEGEITTITVVKRAGAKGADPRGALLATPGGQNPAVALYQEIAQVDPQGDLLALMALEKKIDAALVEGQNQYGLIERAARRLTAAAPAVSPVVVVGF